MAKKTLDLVIELTKELYKIDTSSYIPIKYRKLDIGWIHKKNNINFKISKEENDFIDFKEVKKISRNKNFYAKLNKKYNEFCPVFDQPSFSPKVKFNHNKVFGIDKLFDIERNLLAP